MVHFVLKDHGDNQKGTEVQTTHALAHTHLHYTFHGSNKIVTYGEAQTSTYRLRADTEGTAYMVYTWARYGDLPPHIWHPDPSWHQPLHGGRVLYQGTKPVGSNATGATAFSPATSLTPPSQRQGCPSSIRGPPSRMTPPTAGLRAPSKGPCTKTSTETKLPVLTRAPSPSGQAGSLNNLNPKKLRRVAGPYILYPVPHGMDDHCPGLQPRDPPRGHPCPHALFQSLPPKPAPLPGIYLNAVAGAKGVYLRRETPQSKPSTSAKCTTGPWDHNCPTPTR